MIVDVTADRMFFVFPGQGSQYRGMGSDVVAAFPAAREIFERASATVGYDMQALCFEDFEEQLSRTRYTQPALLTFTPDRCRPLPNRSPCAPPRPPPKPRRLRLRL